MKNQTLAALLLAQSLSITLVGCAEQGPSMSMKADISELHSADLGTRQRAVSRLGESGDEDAVEPLIAALSDPSWEVRGNAVAGLGRLYVQSDAVKAQGTDRLVAPIVALLDAPDPGLRKRVVTTLAWLRDKRAIAPLRALDLKETDASVRQEIVVALGVLGDRESVQPFLDALQNEADPWKRYDAASALGKIGDKRAVDPLIKALEDPAPQVRRAVAMALGRVGDASAVTPLIGLLKDPDANARYRAIEALTALDAASAIPALEWVVRNDTESGNGEKLSEFAQLAIKKLR